MDVRTVKVGGFLRISRNMLKVEHSFELRHIYNLWFTESEICLPLFEYETQPEHKKTDSNLFIVTTSEFSVYGAQNRELSTNPCSSFVYSIEPRAQDYKENHKLDSNQISDSAFGAHLSFCQK